MNTDILKMNTQDKSTLLCCAMGVEMWADLTEEKNTLPESGWPFWMLTDGEIVYGKGVSGGTIIPWKLYNHEGLADELPWSVYAFRQMVPDFYTLGDMPLAWRVMRWAQRAKLEPAQKGLDWNLEVNRWIRNNWLFLWGEDYAFEKALDAILELALRFDLVTYEQWQWAVTADTEKVDG